MKRQTEIKRQPQVARCEGGPSHREDVGGQEWTTSSGKLGAFPGSQKLAGAWNGKPHCGKEKHTGDGVNRIGLRIAFLPPGINIRTKTCIQLLGRVWETTPRKESKGKECDEGPAITTNRSWGDQTGSEGAEGKAESTAGSAIAGCPRPFRGRASRERKKRPKCKDPWTGDRKDSSQKG